MLPWNELRGYGPLAGQRYDPHPLPVGDHPDYAVSYAALDVPTVVAEVFQGTRTIHAAPSRSLTGWVPARDLHLLDITGTWSLRNGASAALMAAPRPVCRAWSNDIATTWPNLDGLWTLSTMTGRAMVVLFAPARGSFPLAPSISIDLADPGLSGVLHKVARQIGYRLVR